MVRGQGHSRRSHNRQRKPIELHLVLSGFSLLIGLVECTGGAHCATGELVKVISDSINEASMQVRGERLEAHC